MKKIIYILISFLVLTLRVNAASFNLTLSASSTSVEENATLDVNIVLGNMSNIENIIVCQTNVTSGDGIIINSIRGANGWSAENGSALILDSANGVSSTTTIGTINITVKGGGSLSLSNSSCTNGDEEATTSGSTLNFNVKKKDTSTTTKDTSTTTKKSEDSTLLSKLTIKDYEIEFDKEKLEYELTVDNTVDKLELEYEPVDKNAKVEVEGLEKLDVGSNIITITVTNGSKNPTKYTLTVIREDKKEYSSNNEEEILDFISKNNGIINVRVDSSDTNKLITTNILKALKKSNKDIIYTVYDGNNKKYSIKIVGKNIINTNAIDFEVTNISNYNIEDVVKNKKYMVLNFLHNGLIPKDTTLTFYNINLKENLYLYSFNSNKRELEYIRDIKNKKELVINTNNYFEYILLEEKANNSYLLLLIPIILIIIVLGAVAINIKKNKN